MKQLPFACQSNDNRFEWECAIMLRFVYVVVVKTVYFGLLDHSAKTAIRLQCDDTLRCFLNTREPEIVICLCDFGFIALSTYEFNRIEIAAKFL